ncbi:MAG: radical SAM protein [Candidatus Magnetomorum sp.]|nr:radical SAM protein [Candidatus Magnetomorum sp.]
MNRILLLNLPSSIHCARSLHRANLGKPGYRWPPVDYICLSGYFTPSIYEVRYCDYQVSSSLPLWQEIMTFQPHCIIAAYSPYFESTDLKQLNAIAKKYPMITVILLANHNDRLHMGHAERILRQNPRLSALIYDYAFNDITDYLQGNRNNHLKNILFLNHGTLFGKIECIPQAFELPVPRHELFRSPDYFHYDSNGGYLTATMASFGCQKNCPFCWGPNLYPQVTTRTPDNLIQEMEYIQSCGFSEVYFHDLTFAHDLTPMKIFCEKLIERSLNLRWFCSTRFDCLTPDMIQKMAAAGCQCIELGLESGHAEIRKHYGKPVSDQWVQSIVSECHGNGIHISVFAILGLPEETRDMMFQSFKNIQHLKPDYISLNIMWAEPLTTFTRSLKTPVKKNPRTQAMTGINFDHPHMTAKEIRQLHTRFMMQFYLSPLTIARQVRRLKSFKRLRRVMHIFLSLIKKILILE